MELTLTRDVFGEDWTLGVLTVDGKSFGFVVEDTDRGLDSADPLAEIKAKKVRGRTAIPTGRYQVRMRWSPKHQRDVPHLLNVPGYQFIEIHPGNDAGDTEGCLCPGLHRDIVGGTVAKSRAACGWLDTKISETESSGGEVWIEVRRAAAVA